MKKISLTNYVTGFALSLVFTLVAYLLVWMHVSSGHTFLEHSILIPALFLLALLQCAVQLVCFLHIGEGSDARERAWALAIAALVVGILVIGSLWIMTHLNARMMQDPAQMEMYMHSQSGL